MNARVRRKLARSHVAYPDSVALVLADGSRAVADLWVDVESTTTWIGFGAPDGCGSGIDHVFSVLVKRGNLSPSIHGLDDDAPHARSEWQRLLSPYRLEYAPSVLTPEWLMVACLKTEEYPASQRSTFGPWWEWTDANGNEQIGVLIDRWNSRPPSHEGREGVVLPLVDGSLHWLRYLGVHPAFRGQHIGLGLVHHALWSLRRAEGDVAFLEARPYGTLFDGKKIESTTEGVQTLVNYYARLGFRRSFPREPISEYETLMHYQFSGISRPTVLGNGDDADDE